MIYIRNNGSIRVGQRFKANSGRYFNAIGGDTSFNIFVGKQGKLVIGDNVGVSNSTIICVKSVVIGNNVLIGGSVKIWDTNFHSLNAQERKGNDTPKTAGIVIEDDVFIGANSFILKGVTIGRESIIGAGSVVAKSIPRKQVWAGNPAVFIRNV